MSNAIAEKGVLRVVRGRRVPDGPRPRPYREGPVPSGGGIMTVGTLVGLTPGGAPLVAFQSGASDRAVYARSCVPLAAQQVGAEVVLAFEDGDRRRPIVIGCLHDEPAAAAPPAAVEATVDRERLVLSADKEIVLRCGDASITLTRAGKVIIRGTYLVSRSSGVNRIKGGSVQIN